MKDRKKGKKTAEEVAFEQSWNTLRSLWAQEAESSD